jgi:hypothetical protein
LTREAVRNHFVAVSTPRETTNTLIDMENYSPVSLFHHFGESVTSNFAAIPNYANRSSKTAKRRSSGRFKQKIQVLVCFTVL